MAAYLLDLVTMFAVFAVAATVVAALSDEAGFMHVGAAAMMGVGAYIVSLLTIRAGADPQLALLATLPAGAVAGVLLHLAVCRLRGDILALGTLAVGIILYGVAVNATGITGGPMGMAGIPRRQPVLGLEALDGLAILGATIGGLWLIRRTRFGSRVRALREDEILAQDLELRPLQVRLAIWAASSAVLALAGGLFAFHFRYVDPSSFTVRESVGVLAMALLIPGRRVFNASFGAAAFIALPEALRFAGLPAGVAAEVRQLVFGAALLVLVVRLKRGGSESRMGGAIA